MRIRRSAQSVAVLSCFAEDVHHWKYGYDISRSKGLKSGTLYPVLMRLARHGLLETKWENAEIGRPPRHLYKLTEDGVQYAKQELTSNEQCAFSTLKGVTAS